MLREGSEFPSELTGIFVSAENKSGKKVKLGELAKGKILILYFYPKDNTPGCTTEAINFRDHLVEFEKRNAKVVGVSRDSVDSHCKFIEKHSLNFPLLVDDSGKITETFGVWVEKSMYGKKYMGVARSTFVIKDSKILKVYDKVHVKKHAEELLSFLDQK